MAGVSLNSIPIVVSAFTTVGVHQMSKPLAVSQQALLNKVTMSLKVTVWPGPFYIHNPTFSRIQSRLLDNIHACLNRALTPQVTDALAVEARLLLCLEATVLEAGRASATLPTGHAHCVDLIAASFASLLGRLPIYHSTKSPNCRHISGRKVEEMHHHHHHVTN
jgi:hypothetical protein